MSIKKKRFVFDLLNREERYIGIQTTVDNQIVLLTQRRINELWRDLYEISKKDKKVRQFLRFIANQPEISYNEEEQAWEISERLLEILNLKEGQNLKIQKIEEKEKREKNWIYMNAVAILEVVDVEEI